MDYFPQTLVSQQFVKQSRLFTVTFLISFFYVLEYDFSLLCSYINRFSIHVDQINIFHFYKALQVTRSHQPRQHHPLASCRVSICRLALLCLHSTQSAFLCATHIERDLVVLMSLAHGKDIGATLLHILHCQRNGNC